MMYYAHSTENIDRSDWQLLSEHLISVGTLAEQFANPFGGGTLAHVAGLLHDLGKYTDKFQARLSGSYERVDHSTWGARVACEHYGSLGKLLAYGIAGHHAGLANGRDSINKRALNDRLKADLPELLSAWKQEIDLPPAEDMVPPVGFRPHEGRAQFQLAFLARMIFSCLVDADFLDTELFYKRISGEKNLRSGPTPDLEILRENLNQHLKKFSTDTDVNKLRAKILEEVRKNAACAPGLFSLTVPTGGGKTLASLAFALDHAIQYGLKRVIYVIPFTSIVEQTAAVFRGALGELGGTVVLEHHSAFIDDSKEAPESKQKLKLAMENWDVPIVVTTAVQFFESLFADRPSKCRKLHNISGSVVILDEAQVLPLKLLRPCVAALDELARNYQSSIVLCTATQPALRAPDFVAGFEDVRELAPEPVQLFQALERVQISHLGLLNDDALVERISSQKQVLCIVNNRRHARALYEAISESSGACHLTTLMCAKHRSQALARVKQRLLSGEPCCLIATSLIEAGVDVDFPMVFRAESGLDSIAQAAGRCNREGKRSVEASEVLVFVPDNEQWKSPPELVQFAQAAREIWRHHSDGPLSLDAINHYFKLLYWQKGSKELDAYDLLAQFEEGGLDGLPFETVAAKFRMIESTQYPIIIPFDDEAKRILARMEVAEHVGGLARQLQPYIVQLPRNGYDALYRAGAILPVVEDKFGEQFMVLVNESLYSNDVGLNWDNPAFIDAERSVM